MGNNNNSNFSLFLMMLMMLLLFLVWKPGNKNHNASTQATELTSNSVANTNDEILLDPTSAATLAEIVKTHGNGTDGVYTLSSKSFNLTATPADSLNPVSGKITVAGSEMEVSDILHNNLSDYTPEQAQQARKSVSDIISTFGRYKSFAPFYYGEEETVELGKDGPLAITISSKGGIIEKAVLNKYDNENTDPETKVTLFERGTGAYGFMFKTADQRIYTDSLYFRPIEVTDTSAVMALPLGKGICWQIRYTLVPEDYIVKMEIEQKGISAVIPPSTTNLTFSWWQKMARNEVGRTFEERNSSLYYKYLGDNPKDLGNNKKKSEDLNSRVKWVAFKNQFFSSIVIPRTSFSSAQVVCEPLKDKDYVKNMSMNASVPYSLNDGTVVAFDFFLGPNSYPLLSKIDSKIDNGGDKLKLNRLVPLGWGPLRWINQFIVIPVFSFLSKYISSYGIIILLLTIFIKLIIFPFTYKSYMSQAKMRVLAPEIKEINEKYPGEENAMKRQQETMSLYSRVGASPFSGCLPMLLQMPILIAMFAFFPSAIELRGQSFLWAHDLSAPDYILTLPFTIPWYGNHVSLFCLLMTATNIIYSYINMQSQPTGPSTGAMKWMMYLMPVMFLFIFNDYASGLSYYYFLSLLITIFQTWIFRKCINESKVRAELLSNAKNKKKKSGGFMARLEQMQKQQEALMRQQAKENAKKRR